MSLKTAKKKEKRTSKYYVNIKVGIKENIGNKCRDVVSVVKVEAEEVLPIRLEGRIKDFSRLATG